MYILTILRIISNFNSVTVLSQIDPETLTRRSYALELKRVPGELTFDRVDEELDNRSQLYNIRVDKIVAWIKGNGKMLDTRRLFKVLKKVDVYKDAISMLTLFRTSFCSTCFTSTSQVN